MRTELSIFCAAAAWLFAVPAVAEPCARLADPLEWLYSDSCADSVSAIAETDVPSNGVAEVNILFNGLDESAPLRFSCDTPGCEWFRLVPVPVEKNTGPEGFTENAAKGEINKFATRRAPFAVCDAMEPLEGDRIAPGAQTFAMRCRLRRFPAGRKSVTLGLRFEQGAFRTNLPFRVNVRCVAVPPAGKDAFKYTNWMDWYGSMRCHGVKSYWTDAHFETIRKYMRLARYGRQNVIPVPFFQGSGGAILDVARYARFVSMAREEGFSYFEGPHLAAFSTGRWDAPAFRVKTSTNTTTSIEGAAELGRLAAAFSEMIERNGWREVWYQHVADEPSNFNAAEYRITAGIVRKYMPGVKLVDAIELPDFAGTLDAYCPKNFKYEKDKARYEALRTRSSDEIWCYTCLVPGGRWMNRLLDQQILAALLLPLGCRAHSLQGYLHWGFNRYAPGRTPFDAGFNGDGPAGDRNLVYPGKDGPWPSVRLEAMRQGMEDVELLRMLAGRDAFAADELLRCVVRGFADFTQETAGYRSMRSRLLAILENTVSTGRKTQ